MADLPSPGALASLQKIYALWRQWEKRFSLACQPGCAACCTQAVLATRLETEYLAQAFPAETTAILAQVSDRQWPAPRLTTNQFAALCLARSPEPDDPYQPQSAPCLFLDARGRCQVYPARPLACRIMASTRPCHEAALPPEIFTSIGSVFMQAVEHLDGRQWGSLWSLLPVVLAPVEAKGAADKDNSGPLRPCHPLPGLLLSNREWQQAKEVIQELLGLISGQPSHQQEKP